MVGCLLETWETDQDGFYDTQYDSFTADCRGRLYTDEEGRYAFRAVLPVAYPIPNDVSTHSRKYISAQAKLLGTSRSAIAINESARIQACPSPHDVPGARSRYRKGPKLTDPRRKALKN